MLPFNVSWAISEMVFIRPSEAVQNIAFLCLGGGTTNQQLQQKQTLRHCVSESALIVMQYVRPDPLSLVLNTHLFYFQCVKSHSGWKRPVLSLKVSGGEAFKSATRYPCGT